MGILDDAIRDHLDLKRRRGTDEPEIKRLEDEAFGPPGRPDASGAADAAIASALATPSAETAVGERADSQLGEEEAAPKPNGDVAAQRPAAETPAPDGPAPEAPPAPQPETGGEEPDFERLESSDEIAFHDFAAEEGLVDVGYMEPSDPEVVADAPPSELPPQDARAEAPASPPTEESLVPQAEDTQVHDMEKELGLAGDERSGQPDEEAAAAPQSEAASDEGVDSLEMDELDIELEDEELELPPDETESEGLEALEADQGDEAEEGEDVLEETPEFLRDTPESDRLWFEQGKPKDFDFDDEE
jgi:hypothetical protein